MYDRTSQFGSEEYPKGEIVGAQKELLSNHGISIRRAEKVGRLK